MSHGINLHDGTGTLARQPNVGVLHAVGTTVPSDGATGYAPGCLFQKTDGANEAQLLYVNVGTSTSANFDAVDLNITESGLLSGLTASASELNIMDGVLATTAEINRATDVSTRIVDCTASSLALTVADHEGKTVTLNRAAGIAVTLPDSTAAATLGAKFRLFIGTTITTTNVTTITRDGTATFFGQIFQLADGGATLAAYELSGSTIITLGGANGGGGTANERGGIKGDVIELQCVASGVWHVVGYTSAANTEETPVT